MKKIFIIIALFFFSYINGQTNEERQKAISLVENLFYKEYYLGNKQYQKLEIIYYELEERFEIKKKMFFSEDVIIEDIMSFYLEDINLQTMSYYLSEIKQDEFAVIIELKANENAVEYYTVETNKKEFPVPTSKREYSSKVDFMNGKLLPKSLMKKYVENIKIMLGVKEYSKDINSPASL
jgi:hypothetical protein